MEITEIKVFPVHEEKLKAYVTIVLNDCFVVRDLKVIHGNTGLFVAMPSKKRRDGTYKDIAHPLNKETRTMLEEKILNAYLASIKADSSNSPPSEAPESQDSEPTDEDSDPENS